MRVFVFIVMFILICSLSFANPILNINSEEKIVYDNILSSKHSKNFIFSLKPLSNYYGAVSSYQNRVKILLNSFDKTGWYLKPVNTITLKVFYTDADYLLIEGSSGLALVKGLNLYSFEDGFFSLGKRGVFYYQLKQSINKDLKRNELFRSYFKFRMGKFSLELGKDNVNWGPGEYGLLLSNNAPPYRMIKFETDKPIEFAGKWKFSILRGWLKEDRRDVSDPNLLGLRIVWKPASFIEIGGTKTTMFGGEGRPSYKLKDYWELISSSKDNVSGKYDNDSYAAYDISVYIPTDYFDIFKIYYQEAGSDVNAIWQEEDSSELKDGFPFIFTLLKPAYQFGLLLSKGKNIFRIEYASTADVFFVHHWYPYEGYTYKGFSLGYPYGRNIRSVLIKFVHYLSDTNWIDFKAGWYTQPADENQKEKRYYLSMEYTHFVYNKIEIKPFLRIDYIKDYDEDRLPTQFSITNKTKLFTTTGLSISLRF